MRGIVVLEGADCSGKTTLAHHLVRCHGARYLHGRHTAHQWRSDVALVRLALRWADERLVVIDRCWLSELIYGTAYRGRPCYEVGARCLDRVLLRGAAVTVLCVPSDRERHLRDHGARHAMGDERYADVASVAATYGALATSDTVATLPGYLGQLTRQGYGHRFDVLTYDLHCEGHQLPLVGARILTALRVVRAAQVPAGLRSDRYNLAGHAGRARWLVVGDRAPARAAATGWPFCWHDGLSSATWLNRALHSLGHRETDTIWCNAHGSDDQLPDLLALGLPTVCLGARSEERVGSLGYRPHAVVSHPRWHRRFRHREPEEYVDLLREIFR